MLHIANSLVFRAGEPGNEATTANDQLLRSLICAFSDKGIPEPALLMKSTGTRTETPTPMPRQLQTSFQESQGKPAQIPTEEMCDPAQNAPLDDHQIVYPKAKRWTIIDSGSKSSPLQTRYSLHPKQPVKPG